MNKSEPRMPKQKRGLLRYHQILDAAEQIIREQGYSALTLRLVATHGRTSMGSIYHYFGDREQLLVGIVKRHYANFAAINAPAYALPDDFWHNCSAAEFVETLFGGIIRYLVDNSGALGTLRLLRSPGRNDLRNIAGSKVKLRLGAAASDQMCDMMYVMFSGVLHFSLDNDEPGLEALAAELPGMLQAYLVSLERLAGR